MTEFDQQRKTQIYARYNATIASDTTEGRAYRDGCEDAHYLQLLREDAAKEARSPSTIMVEAAAELIRNGTDDYVVMGIRSQAALNYAHAAECLARLEVFKRENGL